MHQIWPDFVVRRLILSSHYQPPPSATTTTTEGLDESQNGRFFLSLTLLTRFYSKKRVLRYLFILFYSSCNSCYLLTNFIASIYVLRPNMRVRVGGDDSREIGPNDTRRLPGTCFLNKCFLFFIYFSCYDNETPAIPHPPRSQARAEGGFTHHPTFLARQREPKVGLLLFTSPPPHLPRSQMRAEGGFTLTHITTTPPSSLANASRRWV